MASYINTNLSSMQAQRSLSTSQASLNTSIQRLSSGMRVNGAKDDAAGLAIATGMDKTMRGQTVAMRNANDAISFSQTTEGALGKISDTMQRMRELAVQSANGTNSTEQRGMMDTEFKELQKEVTRVMENTEFNGLKVLGAGSSQVFQIGSGTSDDNEIAIAGKNLAGASETKNAAAITTTQDQLNTNFAKAIADATTAGATQGANILAVDTATAGVTKYEIGDGTDGTIASVDNTTGAVTYAAKGAGAATEAAFRAGLTAAATDLDLTNANVTASEAGAFFTAQTAFNAGPTTGVNIKTASDASTAMDQIDKALKEINEEQTKQGAAQNRMASVISTLQVSNENQAAARSRIMDTDFASETANLARSQILQQASTAMLGQANQLPNGVMRLLG